MDSSWESRLTRNVTSSVSGSPLPSKAAVHRSTRARSAEEVRSESSRSFPRGQLRRRSRQSPRGRASRPADRSEGLQMAPAETTADVRVYRLDPYAKDAGWP